MSDQPTIPHPRRPFFQFPLWAILALVAFAGLLFAGLRVLHEFGERLNAEYTTARVIRDVEGFVTANRGQWPRSWADIPDGEDARQRVRMRFDVTAEDFVRDPQLIHSVIVPVSGPYRTYPHAHSDLEHLRQLLVETRKSQSSP